MVDASTNNHEKGLFEARHLYKFTVKGGELSCIAIPRLLLKSTPDAFKLAEIKYHIMASNSASRSDEPFCFHKRW